MPSTQLGRECGDINEHAQLRLRSVGFRALIYLTFRASASSSTSATLPNMSSFDICAA
jgi:hypothetical protein